MLSIQNLFFSYTDNLIVKKITFNRLNYVRYSITLNFVARRERTEKLNFPSKKSRNSHSKKKCKWSLQSAIETKIKDDEKPEKSIFLEIAPEKANCSENKINKNSEKKIILILQKKLHFNSLCSSFRWVTPSFKYSFFSKSTKVVAKSKAVVHESHNTVVRCAP